MMVGSDSSIGIGESSVTNVKSPIRLVWSLVNTIGFALVGEVGRPYICYKYL